MYLRVQSQHKGFRCLNKSGRVFISKDVVFHEHHIYFLNMFQYNPTSLFQPNCHSKSITFPNLFSHHTPNTIVTNPMRNIFPQVVQYSLSIIQSLIDRSNHIRNFKHNINCHRVPIAILLICLSLIL